MQSMRQILDIHNNLLFQLDKIDRSKKEQIILLLQIFISMASPYVYYAAVIKECSLTIEK